MAQIFISYSHNDEEFVKELTRRLEGVGHSVWIDQQSLRVGASLPGEIAVAVNRADFVIAVISASSLSSTWCQEEVRLAWTRQVNEGHRLILPIRLDASQPPDFLPSMLFVDFLPGRNRESAFARLLTSIEDVQQVPQRKLNCVLTTGSALVEDFLTADPDKVPAFRSDFIRLDEKYLVEERFHHFGGSGVNFTIRLTKAGHPVLPLIAVGHDHAGERLQEVLSVIAAKHINHPGIKGFIGSPDFLCDGLKTAQAIVLSIQGGSRTTFTPRLVGSANFVPFFRRRIDEAVSLGEVNITAIMIGHLHADNPGDAYGELTKSLVAQYAGKRLVFANFGVTQLEYGVSFWVSTLRNASVVQFSLPEVRMFFAKDYPKFSLTDIVEWFLHERITSIITYRNLDVIATCNSDTLAGKVIFAQPFKAGSVIDTTGAGDAFASGLVSVLKDEISINSDTFSKALNAARLWAAFACTTHGGSKGSPTNDELMQFADQGQLSEVDIKPFDEAKRFLDYIDRATTPTLRQSAARIVS